MPKYTIGDAPPQPHYTIGDAPVTPTTGASIGAGAPEPWLDQLDDDLRMGGRRTFIGRTLGRMEGRGDKGFNGLESGVSPAAAQYMGSLPLGAVKMAKGAVDAVHGRPLQSVKDTVGGELQAATIPMSMMAGPEVEEGMAAIPSAEHAASVLNDIEQSAKNVPVYMDETRAALRKFSQHVSTGGKNAAVMSKLGRRIENIGPRPIPEPRPITSSSRLLGGGTEEIPLGTAPRPPEMPGALVDAEHFPPQNVAQTRVIRNGQGQILPRAERMTAFPNENGMMPPARNPYNGRMLTQKMENLPFARKGYMAGNGAESLETPEFSGPGVLLRPRVFGPEPNAPMPDYDPAVNFPEARRFYTNVSDVTRKPGVLGRLLESPRNPRLRMAAGGVREALNSDLTDAANRVGRGKDYANAMSEYRNAMRLRKFVRRAGILAGAEAARRTGILGRTAHDLTLGH